MYLFCLLTGKPKINNIYIGQYNITKNIKIMIHINNYNIKGET